MIRGTEEGYNPEEESLKKQTEEREISASESGDSAQVAEHAESGIEAIKRKETEVIRYHARECHKFLSEDTKPEDLGLAENFANELMQTDEAEFGRELSEKISSIKEKMKKAE